MTPLHGLIACALTMTLAAGCAAEGEPETAPAGGTSSAASASGGPTVAPVTSNPIQNDSTAEGLVVTKVLVENNVDTSTGKDAPDHLEIELQNTSDAALSDFSVYYTITDPKTSKSESYYQELTGFSLAPGEIRAAHIDGVDKADHYPVNKFSLYYTGENELTVDVVVSSPTVKPATGTVKKDAKSAEAGVE